jgi:hypothetical protein
VGDIPIDIILIAAELEGQHRNSQIKEIAEQLSPVRFLIFRILPTLSYLTLSGRKKIVQKMIPFR